MMGAKLEYQEVLHNISNKIAAMSEAIEQKEPELLRKAGKEIKQKVEKHLRRSSVEEIAKKVRPANYDGSRPYVHMRDDVKATVKRTKDGSLYAKICGGKYTGYKWHLVNDGTVNIPGSHFIESALKESEGYINGLIDEALKDGNGDA